MTICSECNFDLSLKIAKLSKAPFPLPDGTGCGKEEEEEEEEEEVEEDEEDEEDEDTAALPGTERFITGVMRCAGTIAGCCKRCG